MSGKTIDNLGVETYNRYALDQEILDKKILVESALVSAQAEVQVMEPIFAPSLETFLGAIRLTPWAAFYPPLQYNMQKKRIFTSKAIPSLGSEEYMLTQMERVKGQRDIKREERKERSGKQELGWEDEREERDEERESLILMRLFEQIQTIDKNLSEITSRCNQFKRG